MSGGGSLVSLFADDILIDGITSDVTACGTTSPIAGTGFVEIGSSNNHVTNGHNVHVVWAGIDSVYNHARKIEIDRLNWSAPYAPFELAVVSGA